jgi:hypothetical protein
LEDLQQQQHQTQSQNNKSKGGTPVVNTENENLHAIQYHENTAT